MPALVLGFVLGLSGSAAQAASFEDVPASHPNQLAIEVMAQLGVVSGFSDGSFRPDTPVTRQQFAKMMVLALRISVSESDVSPFADVPSSGPGSLFPDNYVAAVAREGITTGTTSSVPGAKPLFKPGDRITLAQVVTMMTRGSGRPLVQPPAKYRSVWGDFDVSHGPTARLAQYNGLLRYTPALSASPWKAATRAETAALLYNLMGTDPEGLNGLFLGSSADLVEYFRKRGRTSEKFTIPLADLAKLYVLYGRRFGIRADTAWAQMVHETGFGEYGGDVLPDQNNMAGIGATGGVPGNSFATAELGVIAHYAHLAWYVYPDHLDDPYCVASSDPAVPGDPRHFVIDGRPHRGNVRTVLDLGGKWAPSGEYGTAVLRHAQGIVPTVGW
ncbi:MAG: S-layer homology domain-containing protein [Thermoleophilia bacterium]|nr:S-layer homology domain-containing protein [Thermoleophilia bacterium]